MCFFFRKRRERPVVEPFLELDDQLLLSFPKWDRDSLKKAEDAKTLDEARQSYNESRPGSEGMTLSLEKWNVFSKQEADKSKNFEEAYAAYCRSPKGTFSMVQALSKMDEYRLLEGIDI